MTAYHATHESPYDDACPDCTGYGGAEPARSMRDWSRVATAIAIVGLLVLVTIAWWER